MNEIKHFHQAFNTITAQHGIKVPLTEDQFDDLIGFAGYREVTGSINRAKRDDNASVNDLVHWARISGAASAFTALGIAGVNLQKVFGVFQANALERIRTVTMDASRGDAAAVAILTEWVRNAPETATRNLSESRPEVRSIPVQRIQPQQGSTAPVRTPTHPTSVPPPTADDPRTQVGVRHAQRAPAHANSAHEHATPPSRNNVREMPTRNNHAQADDDDMGRDFAAPRQPETTERRKYDQVNVFGRDTGLSIDRCPNKDRTTNTINLAIAKAKGQSTKGGMNWDGAIRLMLVPQEVQLIGAVLLGLTKSVRFAGHGADNKKWFQVERCTGQYAGVKFTIADKDQTRHVLAGFNDLGAVTAIFIRTMKDQLQVDATALPMVLRSVVQTYEEIRAHKEQSAPPAAANGRRG